MVVSVLSVSDFRKHCDSLEVEMASPSAASHASTDSVESSNNAANSSESAAQQSSTSDCFSMRFI